MADRPHFHRNKSCGKHSNCNTCKGWEARSKSNGKRCAGLYWALKKTIEKMGDAIEVDNSESLHKILEDLNGQPSEDSDLKGGCVVCYESFNTTIHKPVALQCGHVMCLSCIGHVKESMGSCPKCSKMISKVIPLFL